MDKAEPVPCERLAWVTVLICPIVLELPVNSLLALLSGALPNTSTPTAPLTPTKPPPPAVAVIMSILASRSAFTLSAPDTRTLAASTLATTVLLPTTTLADEPMPATPPTPIWPALLFSDTVSLAVTESDPAPEALFRVTREVTPAEVVTSAVSTPSPSVRTSAV